VLLLLYPLPLATQLREDHKTKITSTFTQKKFQAHCLASRLI
jgi:hypothetical protein